MLTVLEQLIGRFSQLFAVSWALAVHWIGVFRATQADSRTEQCTTFTPNSTSSAIPYSGGCLKSGLSAIWSAIVHCNAPVIAPNECMTV